MKKLLSYLVLPTEISEFERKYLARMNRIALVFFGCHLPLFVCVALLAGTSVVQTLILTPIFLFGPFVAYRTVTNPRHLSLVFGFTAMCMGGLLVHFGKGPMQIEMHFYFFTLIALLAVFANPMAIIAAAVTVALHHLVLYLILPSSVFNYEASIWAVGVHVAFVVLESVAACFVARSFFDNVIGLEKIVKKRTDDLRLVLDNVGQGFLSIDLDGTLSSERSAIVDTWFGPFVPGKKLWEYVTGLEPGMPEWFRLGWEAVVEDVLPLDMAVGQLPKRWKVGARSYALDYRPVMASGKLSRIVLVISDVTAELERERFEAEQRDFLRVFEHIVKDKKGFQAFFTEGSEIVSNIIADEGPGNELRRQIHTLKGNSALFGLSRLAAFCHDLESGMAEGENVISAEDRGRLGEMWGTLVANLRALLGRDQSSLVEVEHEEYTSILTALAGDVGREEIAWRIRAWEFEVADRSLSRVAGQARAIAARLGKSAPEVVIEANDVRLLPERWAEFWAAFTHVVRNAVDHGLETAAERTQAGKPAAGRIQLRASLANDELAIEISDDGRGIDWQLVRQRASAMGLPCAKQEDLVEAMFHDGLTTRRDVSEFSGRGIGMGAVRAVCARMGGTVEIASTPGAGTTVRFVWPEMLQRIDPIVLGPRALMARVVAASPRVASAASPAQ
jgi:signal transduction histidine kinase